ncbi:hypothetical protein HYU93_04530 [Candidatus Daviesbacteria bacterium]|nr:hypothetical protein [Candidatus Daviesbacteria bacterium]
MSAENEQARSSGKKGLRFLSEDKEILKRNGYRIYLLHGRNLADLEQEGLRFTIADDLKEELLKQRPQNRSHQGEVAFMPERTILPDSNCLTLEFQDGIAKYYGERERGRLGLRGVRGGIARFADYGEIISNYLQETGVKLLGRSSTPYPSARTRTRVFPEMVGPQNFVVDTGPYDSDGLNVRINSRDETDGDIGAWPLLYPTAKPKALRRLSVKP